MTAPYLWHLTIDTGHSRQSYRHEISDSVIAVASRQIDDMLAGLSPEIYPGYRLSGARTGAALLATVSKDADPVVTIAVARNSKVSARLWKELARSFGASGAEPLPPWCAVKLHPALVVDVNTIKWLGDYERILAWAWISPDA